MDVASVQGRDIDQRLSRMIVIPECAIEELGAEVISGELGLMRM